MIDYIFYSRHLLRTVGLLGPLDAEWIKSNKIVGFPHPHVPSDHLPLMVELELYNSGANNNTNNNTSGGYNNRAGQQLHSQHHLNSNNGNGGNNSMNGQLGIGQMIPINTNSSSGNNFLRK
jgi:hypothetical protein